MVIKEQSGLRAVLKDIPIPPVYVVRQNFPQDGIPDVSACLREKLDREELRSRIRPGMRVVLTAGSRQIAHMPEILQELARFLKGQGAKPYIIPTMGSHGGATAEGQRNILESYGITEEFCECPIFSSMETVEVGKMPDGDPVRMDRFAFESDAVVVVGRIKGHTAFRGPSESGLVLPSEEIFDKEPALLTYAKSRMPRLLFPETDLLLVREIGKNFSGNGMDPNVTGTFGTPYASGGIQKQRTVVLDISAESHGSFVGLGTADVTTKRAFEKLDTNTTYFNMITTKVLGVGKIPVVMEDDRLAIQTALKTLADVDPKRSRIVYLKNTLSLQTIMISEALLDKAKSCKEVDILEGPRPFSFDADGNLMDLA